MAEKDRKRRGERSYDFSLTTPGQTTVIERKMGYDRPEELTLYLKHLSEKDDLLETKGTDIDGVQRKLRETTKATLRDEHIRAMGLGELDWTFFPDVSGKHLLGLFFGHKKLDNGGKSAFIQKQTIPAALGTIIVEQPTGGRGYLKQPVIRVGGNVTFDDENVRAVGIEFVADRGVIGVATSVSAKEYPQPKGVAVNEYDSIVQPIPSKIDMQTKAPGLITLSMQRAAHGNGSRHGIAVVGRDTTLQGSSLQMPEITYGKPGYTIGKGLSCYFTPNDVVVACSPIITLDDWELHLPRKLITK